MRCGRWTLQRMGLCAVALALTCASTWRQDAPGAGSNLQVSLAAGDFLAPDYVSIPVYVTVINGGPDAAEDVRVSIELPPVLPGRPLGDGYACTNTSDTTIECTLPGLEVDARAVITVEMSMPPEPIGELTLHATATARGTELAPDDNRAMLSTRGPGRLRLSSGGCSSTAGEGSALGVLGGLLVGRRKLRLSPRASPAAAGGCARSAPGGGSRPTPPAPCRPPG